MSKANEYPNTACITEFANKLPGKFLMDGRKKGQSAFVRGAIKDVKVMKNNKLRLFYFRDNSTSIINLNTEGMIVNTEVDLPYVVVYKG